ncbi:MAG: hypothetical protein NZM27_08390 [Acetobacteraceae bacterium]|nr:hypothetical protein [Acetobacteraceae bacterium]MCX7685762.1 hypothetical protein [Acetobacteraceae bacterium]MDW8397311.1 hypothetical protein [Acetobacteraceae bacterium]
MRALRALAVLLLLSACAEVWERPGATEEEAERTLALCTARAAREVPPALVWTMVEPPRWIPGERVCRQVGDRLVCSYYPGRHIPARFEWVDSAEGQRRAVRNACMAEAGFSFRGLRPLRLH